MTKNKSLKATSLKSFLSILVVLIIGLSATGLYFIQSWFKDIASSINSSNNSQTVGENSPQSLKQIREEIVANQPIADKANLMIVPLNSYKEKIISDIQKYASSSGVSVTSSVWTTNNQAITGLSGIDTKHITVTLKNPTAIDNLLEFLRHIELSTPKLQVTGINLSKPANSQDSNQVNISPLVIEVYTK